MRRFGSMVPMVIVLLLAACSSSSEPMAIEFSVPMGPGQGEVTGAAVDEGIVCAAGTLTRLGMETTDGALISEQQAGANWEAAMESGATVEVVLLEEFNCSDGSGSISIVVDNVVQPSALDFEGVNDVGSWVIEGGTGAYEELSGEGEYMADFGNGLVSYAGEVVES